MSRTGKRPIIIDSSINVVIKNNKVYIEGPKGRLQYRLPNQVKIRQQDNKLVCYIIDDNKESKALHGLSRAIVSNMVTGVSKGFCKTLKIQGVGYRAQFDKDQNLILNLGYSHSVNILIPEEIDVKINNGTEVNIEGISKEIVGQFAAQIRAKRPPEPYKGKGIRYINETIRKKAGKAGK